MWTTRNQHMVEGLFLSWIPATLVAGLTLIGLWMIFGGTQKNPAHGLAAIGFLTLAFGVSTVSLFVWLVGRFARESRGPLPFLMLLGLFSFLGFPVVLGLAMIGIEFWAEAMSPGTIAITFLVWWIVGRVLMKVARRRYGWQQREGDLDAR